MFADDLWPSNNGLEKCLTKILHATQRYNAGLILAQYSNLADSRVLFYNIGNL